MDIAAVASFALLLIGWIVAPDRQHARETVDVAAPEACPIAA